MRGLFLRPVLDRPNLPVSQQVIQRLLQEQKRMNHDAEALRLAALRTGTDDLCNAAEELAKRVRSYTALIDALLDAVREDPASSN